MSASRPWDQDGGKERSYLGEMLAHQYTLYGLLSSLAASTFLAIPYDLGVAALPLLGFVGATSLAALFVPGVPSFRRSVDQRRRTEKREATRAHLLADLAGRVSPEHAHWRVYQRMLQRVESLRSLSASRKSAFSEADVERLDDATVDYLGLWLSRISMAERYSFLSAQNLDVRIDQAKQRLLEAKSADRKSLEKALEDLIRLARSRDRIEARATSVDAAMLAMSDAFEEVYQGVMSNPSSTDASTRLREAVERMRIEDDLGSALDEDVEALLGKRAVNEKRAASAR